MTDALAPAPLEPATQAWVDALSAAGVGQPALYELSPRDAREVLRSVQSSVRADLLPADVDDVEIDGGAVGKVSLRVVKPLGGDDRARPIVLHTHGGGWILGDKDTHDRLVRELANGIDAVVVFVDYTPAPEARYPTQIQQAYAALTWAAAHAAQIGGDPSRIAVFGDSVGGNMAAALTMMTRDREGPALAAQALVYPVTDADFDTVSYRQYADGPWLTRRAMMWFWDAYLPDVSRRHEPTASPLRATVEQLADLPPALVITDGDVLRDEGEAYADKLAKAGTPVVQVRYGGTLHDFLLLNPIAKTPPARAATAQAIAFLRNRLV
jgi:acetyl esterase